MDEPATKICEEYERVWVDPDKHELVFALRHGQRFEPKYGKGMIDCQECIGAACLIEYDGVFFWPSNKRFYSYNGIVQELPHTMNLNYFFKNIDMEFRQEVFGIRNTQYGEIWWFYPEKIGTPGRINVGEGKNSRALIYNVRENCWYDTAWVRTDKGMLVYASDGKRFQGKEHRVLHVDEFSKQRLTNRINPKLEAIINE